MTNIPKIIHYIWFGEHPKPDIVVKSIESWKKYFPDYQLIEWNENNYDVNKNDYVTEAYNCKKWAFVSDYARFDILYQFGGVYFDTDVEVLKCFPETIFENRGFTGVESTNVIAPGLVFGCEKNHPFLKKILNVYENSHFIIDDKECAITVNSIVTTLMEENGYSRTGEKQIIEEICIYPSEVFCGFDLDVFEPNITENTLSRHHYASSWVSNTFMIKRNLQRLLKKLIGVENYRMILKLVRKIRNHTSTKWRFSS